MSSFYICKNYSHFFSKNTCELDIVLTRTVKILATNGLVKLMTRWTTGPKSSRLQLFYSQKTLIFFLFLLKKTLWVLIRSTHWGAWPASVAQLDALSDWRPGGRGFNPRRGRQHSFVEIDHEIFSTVILFLPLIQEGQLSVSGERMCTILVNRWED